MKKSATTEKRIKKDIPHKKRADGKIPLYIAIGSVLLLFLIFAVINMIIGVRSIEVEGTDMSSAEEIVSASGIREGSGYFSYNTGKAERAVLESVHTVEEIKITRSVFGKVRITVTEKKAIWYTEFFGNYLALSDALEVIKSEESFKGYEDRGLVRLDLPVVHSAILGRPIEFSDGDRDCSFIWSFLDEIRECELYKEGRIDQVCVETKFEIFVVCDLKYKIKLGRYSSACFKLNKARDVLRDETFSGEGKWEIDVSGAPDIVSRPEDQLDFEHLIP